ncbi:MAG: phospho-N-acetylmuramoyl-pentapeptide-transferase [Clostridiales bacterium]|nr:MAG: phospho-N-acetylmuramoyl-pentapeptide-transferase [Clostridiales bacterium]PWL48773.1 MAG: phospho-N-acetylmuramoyl-pentapeptide-transferase [Clostridiales bacterium]
MQTLILAILLSFLVSLGLGHIAIPLLHRLKFGQPIREDGPKTHLKKSGTPTMGGIFMALAMIVVALIFIGECGSYLWAAVLGSIAFSIIGLIDDMKKVLEHNSKGLRAWQKIVLQLFFGMLVAIYAYYNPQIGSELYIPFWGQTLDFGIWYIPFCVIFMIALTNSVNLTDGLDGLAGSVTVVDAAAFALIFLAAEASVLQKDAMIFAGILVGAVMGFLRYNTYPARVMMGDVGSFLLGGALSMLAIFSKLQLMVPIMGVMFMLSSISCILQVGSYKLRKKRIFKMAPLHHHFELLGVHETKIVSVYTLITVAACLLAMLLI